MRLRHILSSVATLLLMAGHLAAQDPPVRDTTAAQRPRRARVVTDLSGFDLLDTLRLREQTMAVGASRGTDAPLALAPRLGKAFGVHPVFSWSHEGGPQSFTLTVWNDAQKKVHRAEVSGSSFRYPSDAPSLEPGKAYVWSVAPQVTLLGGSPSLPVGILVVDPEQREAIEAELADIRGDDAYATGLERARVFTRHRVWYDAIGAYTDLIAEYPDRAELYEERGMIYAQLGATQDLAAADFVRADEWRLP